MKKRFVINCTWSERMGCMIIQLITTKFIVAGEDKTTKRA